MQAVAIKIAWAIFTKLITGALVEKILVYGLDYWAKKTDNKLDDKMVSAIAEALDVEIVRGSQ